MMDITKKWTGHRQDCGQIHSQLEIYFEERLSGYSPGISRRKTTLNGIAIEHFTIHQLQYQNQHIPYCLLFLSFL